MELTGKGWLFVFPHGAKSEEAAGAGRPFVCLFGVEEWGRQLGTDDLLVFHSLAIWSSIAEPVLEVPEGPRGTQGSNRYI